jgi:predicted ester cyclase
MADDAVLAVSGMTFSCNPNGTKAIAREWTTAFPDWHFELLALVADGDLVAAHMPYQGTFTHPLFGTPPTQRSATVDEMVIFQIADGKIARAWEVYDEAGMWRQLGTTPLG